MYYRFSNLTIFVNTFLGLGLYLAYVPASSLYFSELDNFMIIIFKNGFMVANLLILVFAYYQWEIVLKLLQKNNYDSE